MEVRKERTKRGRQGEIRNDGRKEERMDGRM